MTGASLSSLRRNVLDDLTTQFGIDTHLNDRNEFKMFGNTIVCAGASHADTYKVIRGFTSYGWYANEVTLHHANMVNEAFDRCSGQGSKIYWDTNPESPSHPIKIDYIDKSGLQLDSGSEFVRAWQFRLEDNTFLSAEYVESQKERYPLESVWYRRNILGDWVYAGNTVYSGWKYVDRPPARIDQIYYGLDFGYSGNPAALIRVYQSGNEYYYQEVIYETGLTNQDLCDRMRQEDIDRNAVITADSSEPKSIEEIRRNGFNIRPAEKGTGSVMSGIKAVAEKRNHIIEPSINLKREYESYEWKVDRNGEVLDEPLKVHDHAMDAIRYAVNKKPKATARYIPL
jgi:PBSX family phage terminase large subunit